MGKRTGRASTPEGEQRRRANLRAANLVQFSDPEARAHHSRVVAKLWADPVYRNHMVNIHRGKKLPSEQIAKIVARHKGRKRPLETRRRISEAAKRRWATYSLERRKEISAPGLLVATPAARKARPSRLEVAVQQLLNILGIEYITEHRVGRYVVDMFVPARRLVIECDGEYWHSLPGVAEKDARRDRELHAAGYTVVRLPEKEIAELTVGELQRVIA